MKKKQTKPSSLGNKTLSNTVASFWITIAGFFLFFEILALCIREESSGYLGADDRTEGIIWALLFACPIVLLDCSKEVSALMKYVSVIPLFISFLLVIKLIFF